MRFLLVELAPTVSFLWLSASCRSDTLADKQKLLILSVVECKH